MDHNPNTSASLNSSANTTTDKQVTRGKTATNGTTNNSTLNGATMKNHKVEGKNKKSLHQKQHQQQQQQQQKQSSSQNQQRQADTSHASSGTTNNRRAIIHQKNVAGSNKSASGGGGNATLCSPDDTNVCITLEDFSKRAQELKGDINKALEKQKAHQIIDQPMEVVKLKEDIIKLSGLDVKDTGNSDDKVEVEKEDKLCNKETENSIDLKSDNIINVADSQKDETVKPGHVLSYDAAEKSSDVQGPKEVSIDKDEADLVDTESACKVELSSDIELAGKEKIVSNDSHTAKESLADKFSQLQLNPTSPTKIVKSSPKKRSNTSEDQVKKPNDIIVEGFEPLNAKLDLDTKYVTLVSSLKKHFTEAPYLLEPVCRRLVSMSEENDRLTLNCEKYQVENAKLLMIKQKLENICRELQKSNNAIRIESLDLIKVEQVKAKEQTTKIQSTLSGVIKLFDENQQRNMSLRQENQDLQTKLKSLLDHCDNWEKSVEVTLRQKDIENRLLKTELAKSNLLKNEEKEKFLGEKQELLQILSMMQEQQHRIEGQEAKLRFDLSCYASKYDECQAVISKGMSRFQTESERMLKQIERSKEDYKILLSKYESSNKKMTQLLEEKQHWDKAMNLANKKVDTLEKLCRALRERKAGNKNDNRVSPSQNKNKGKANDKNETPQSKPDIITPEVRHMTEIKSESVVNQIPGELVCETGQKSSIEGSLGTDAQIETKTGDKDQLELNRNQIQESERESIDKELCDQSGGVC